VPQSKPEVHSADNRTIADKCTGGALRESLNPSACAFDLLTVRGQTMQKRPYRERRAALEALFAQQGLRGTWALCPSTTDPQLAQEWLNWPAAGMEGLVFKPLNSRYTPTARGWQKYKVKHTTEAVIGGVSGSLTDPRTILLGRYDSIGRLQYVGRTTVLSRGVSRDLARHLVRAGDHPGWHSKEKLVVALVVPELVAGIRADIALDQAGRWRHPLTLVRLREDLAPPDVALFEGSTRSRP
jgi:ATP-dependent DNA ligase